MADTNLAAIAAQEERRYAAMRAADVATLDSLLHDDLLYVHSSGVADSKSSYVDGVRSGLWRYEKAERSGVAITVGDRVALVSCMLSLRLIKAGKPIEFDSRVVATWVEDDGTWRLLSTFSRALDRT